MKAVMDGDMIHIRDSTFEDLQESDDYIWLNPKELSKEQLKEIGHLMGYEDLKLMWTCSNFNDESYLDRD